VPKSSPGPRIGSRAPAVARTYQIPRPFAHSERARQRRADGDVRRARRSTGREPTPPRALAALHGACDSRSGALPGDLNLHQTKFLELARALRPRRRLLLLDEVLSGLTPAEIDEAVDLILRIRRQGTTIVLVEHVMRVVTALSDRIVVLDQGRVLARGQRRRRDGTRTIVAAA
jgi:branched-chain amino acid transport system permease protein